MTGYAEVFAGARKTDNRPAFVGDKTGILQPSIQIMIAVIFINQRQSSAIEGRTPTWRTLLQDGAAFGVPIGAR
jgi:hypothetical protein